MAYTTLQNLIDRYGEAELIELTDRADPPAGIVDTDVVDRALADADTLIDGYVGRRYDLPLAATPPLLATLAGAIARYHLYADDPTDKVTEDTKAAIKTLREIAGGAVVLDVAGAAPARTGDTIATEGPDRLFTRDTLEGF